MNTNELKRFAQAARKKLLDQIGSKLEFVLSSDSAELRERAEQIWQLKVELQLSSKAMLVEKVAYTWFNRFVALRFMDVNDYQPSGLRVISPRGGYTLPEILDEAKQGNFPFELDVDKKRINDLLDGVIPSANPQNEAYKLLVISYCNYLHKLFPFLFERINDYTELLLPDDLTSDFSVLQDIREGMPAEDSRHVEIIGWLYQFYISEKKDEVFSSKEKVKKDDIPAATQLFTPRWVVEYMVQNTLGKLWLQNRPKSKLRAAMPYFIPTESLKSNEYLQVTSPEEIKLLDQAVGSGHILVYAFELFTQIYEEEGYNQAEIATLIIENNVFGNEIDERAAQLAALVLMMKAREYDKRFFRRPSIPEPRILCFKDFRFENNKLQKFLIKLKLNISKELWRDLETMRQSTNLGSLIIPQSSFEEIQKTIESLNKVKIPLDTFEEFEMNEFKSALAQLAMLTSKYHCIVDNPPYMGNINMNKELSDYVKLRYPDSKADLMSCFMEAGIRSLMHFGFLGMINQLTWMFLSSYEELRKKIIRELYIDTLLHLGARTFPEIGGEVVQNVSFTIHKTQPKSPGTYIKLTDFDTTDSKRMKLVESLTSGSKLMYGAHQQTFEKIAGSPIAYWLSDRFIKIFEETPPISSVALLRQGMATTNNVRFLKYWHEISFRNIGIGFSPNEAKNSKYQWFPYNKGGTYRKWYGNNEYVINYTNNGNDLLELVRKKYPRISDPEFVIKNRKDYFREGATWSSLTSGAISFRHSPPGFVFDAKGQMLFSVDSKAMMAFMNTKLSNKFLEVLSPTLDFNLGYIQNVPYKNSISIDVDYFVAESKLDWDSREVSWDFKQNELIRIHGQDLEETYDLYQQYWKNKFFELHRKEEELNRQFIELYDLHDELTPDVPLEDITILTEEAIVENGRLIFRADEVFAQFMSYAVGCIFGRYSLDQEGLILVNQNERIEDYLKKIARSKNNLTFAPSDNNIVPVLEDEWFEDGIVSRFYEFLKASFGEAYFDKNLAFIEECLGMKVRKYLTKNFYADHVKRYKKRPIYWMFSSPKAHFNILIYMHRYAPDTINIILNDYLREFLEKLKTRKEHLKHILVSGSATEQSSSLKQLDKLEAMILDCQEYEREIVFPLATERITINLEDGVLVNYNKFGKALREVQGLNDKKTKKQVQGFDWIDKSKIR